MKAKFLLACLGAALAVACSDGSGKEQGQPEKFQLQGSEAQPLHLLTPPVTESADERFVLPPPPPSPWEIRYTKCKENNKSEKDLVRCFCDSMGVGATITFPNGNKYTCNNDLRFDN